MGDPTLGGSTPRKWEGQWIEVPSWAFEEYAARMRAGPHKTEEGSEKR